MKGSKRKRKKVWPSTTVRNCRSLLSTVTTSLAASITTTNNYHPSSPQQPGCQPLGALRRKFAASKSVSGCDICHFALLTEPPRLSKVIRLTFYLVLKLRPAIDMLNTLLRFVCFAVLSLGTRNCLLLLVYAFFAIYWLSCRLWPFIFRFRWFGLSLGLSL